MYVSICNFENGTSERRLRCMERNTILSHFVLRPCFLGGFRGVRFFGLGVFFSLFTVHCKLQLLQEEIRF